MKNSTSIFHHALHAFDDLVFSSPKAVLAVLLLVTVFFGMQIPGVRMYSDFADLLPQEHRPRRKGTPIWLWGVLAAGTLLALALAIVALSTR